MMATVFNQLVPPTLLLLMLIDRFAKYNPIIIQSQGLDSRNSNEDYYYPQPYTEIVESMDDKEKKLKPYEQAFVNQLDDQTVKKILSQDNNITLAFKKDKNDKSKHWNQIETFKDEKAERFSEYFKKKENIYIPIKLNLNEEEKKEYGGHLKGTLVGSTAAWKEYFKLNPNLFDHVYYLPVWNDYFTQINEKKDKDTDKITEIKHNLWDTPEEKPEQSIKYKKSENVEVIISGNPVTKLIQEACNNKIFTNDGKRIEVIEGCVKKLIVEKISNVQLLIKQFNNPQTGGRRTKNRKNKKSKKVNRKNTRKTLKNKRKSTKKKECIKENKLFFIDT